MSIQVGERIPSVTLSWMGSDGPTTISTNELFKGKKVVLFAVPGAFTPACSEQHHAAIIEDGVLKSIEVEQPGQVEVSKAEKVLLNL
ncbi:MAG: hypothetical protein N4J56_002360 [Chroococcidiopsis sp. SAG 2025]|uniref:redoxin family protein n=1 Tax=Chroococcidiopsis sp. SAG 2025 TaxID=171389 RepID=UPI002937206A|nr:redoxin family protein [Chroococcidiopsis sp. SAG 2025]MDV2992706.1 hypothetical protein [Chroococcidiopsis sp. SAG 2025]